MTKVDENIQTAQNILDGIVEKCYKLEEENKKLKESLDIATKCSSKEEDGIIKLSEENKKLKAEIEIWKLTAKDYAKQCGIELDDNLDNIIKEEE